MKECARALHAHCTRTHSCTHEPTQERSLRREHLDTGTQMCALTQVDTASKFEAALIGVNLLVVAAGLGLCIYCAVEDKFRYLGSDMYR